MASTSEWLHSHQTNNPSNPPQPVTAAISQTTDNHFWSGGQQLSSESTVVSTTTNPPAQQLAPADGRVSKPTRRRTRASRRTPTTLLNTDTTNFRAMVQQFTGGPATAFGFGPPQPPPARWNPGFGLQQFQNYADHHHHQISSGAGNSSSNDNLVQQGAGRGGGDQVMFGNINGELFPSGASSSENRTANNNGSAGGSSFQF